MGHAISKGVNDPRRWFATEHWEVRNVSAQTIRRPRGRQSLRVIISAIYVPFLERSESLPFPPLFFVMLGELIESILLLLSCRDINARGKEGQIGAGSLELSIGDPALSS